MAKSISVKRKSAGRPATGTEPLYGVRIADPLMKQIMGWAKAHDATRSEAIRRLVEIGLSASPKQNKRLAERAEQLAGAAIDKRLPADAPKAERETRKRKLLKGGP